MNPHTASQQLKKLMIILLGDNDSWKNLLFWCGQLFQKFAKRMPKYSSSCKAQGSWRRAICLSFTTSHEMREFSVGISRLSHFLCVKMYQIVTLTMGHTKYLFSHVLCLPNNIHSNSSILVGNSTHLQHRVST